ncbi:uncharacterized protein EV420DRAFT_1026537 [Desarmillaria tabescens]|uniref:Uncharacterized protein n=1 Tax=Armillaria tabescens TaxID=1929756 RepID=A0AA39JIY8_ARMTA|nr:uncharacterized protein EV420DRAFT_1026537 [Desarmillaria tabescens]KAK0443324.1 hypothetical protein EV420DRAFT_1026537 [Desarmillaria tabescens]
MLHIVPMTSVCMEYFPFLLLTIPPEFAFEIGSGLLNEVRRLQSLLGDREKAIQDMTEKKDDLDGTLESLRTALKQQEASADKYKEENWNLEVSLQDLHTQHADTQSTVQRLDSEQKRLTKLLAASHDASEQYKNENAQLQSTIKDLIAKHETDVALARKHFAALAHDKSDLQQAIDRLETEKERAGRKFGGFGSPATPNTTEGRPDENYGYGLWTELVAVAIVLLLVIFAGYCPRFFPNVMRRREGFVKLKTTFCSL